MTQVLHWHAESDCYWYAVEFDDCDGQVADVTHLPDHVAAALNYGVVPPPPVSPAIPPPPVPLPPLESLRAGQQVQHPWGVATILPDIDFETYSEAGHIWDQALQKWVAPRAASKRGLGVVGAAVYSEHPSTEALMFAYDLKRGEGRKQWRQGMPPPPDLLEYLAAFDPAAEPSYTQDGLIEAHNSMFEVRIFLTVLHERCGWPKLDIRQFRCSMAKSRAYALPGALGDVAPIVGVPLESQKSKEGKRLITKFTQPRQPTKANRSTRNLLQDDPKDGPKFYDYNIQDIVAESEVSRRVPDLTPDELRYWLVDQACNWRGIGVDRESINACMDILDQAHAKYNAELYVVTGGVLAKASEVAQLTRWLYDRTGRSFDKLDSDVVDEALEQLRAQGGDPQAIRALEIRSLIGSASVKKVYAMGRMATREDRLCDLIIFHGARTGRDAHSDVQPGNLPKAGPPIRWCGDATCMRPYAKARQCCPWCGASDAFSSPTPPDDPKSDPYAWHWRAVDHALEIMRVGSLDLVELFFGEACLLISGCVRGLLCAAPGHDLVSSDYSSIEAVTLAVLAGEQWRIDAFHRREDIYYHGAAGITGTTYAEYMAYHAVNGKHPDRNKIGKVAELALGFMGWIGAWKQFDKSGNFDDNEIRDLIVKWRAASPALVELAGGQIRGVPWRPERMECYGYEGAFVQAILNPGEIFDVRGVTFQMLQDKLSVKLLSGRRLTYHSPRATATVDRWGNHVYKLSYMGWNTNPKMGPRGWIRIETYAGRLVENITQATARDFLSFACVNLEAAGYRVVLRVHDEIVSEVPEGWGSVEEFEAIMGRLPPWAHGWPVRAAGGWRGKRFRKD